MTEDDIALLKQMMDWKGPRRALPEGFPDLPDITVARYTSEDCYRLEREHIFR